MREPEHKSVEREEPRRKPSYPALSKATAQASLDARLGKPYVPLANNKHGSGKNKWWLAVGLAVAVAVGTGSFYVTRSSTTSSASAAPTREKTLVTAKSDIDLELTTLARSMLAERSITDDVSQEEESPAAVVAPESPAKAGTEPVGASALEERKKLVRTVLSHATPRVRSQIASGEQAIYRLHVLDDCIEDGDAVILYANGTSYGKVQLTNKGQTILIPLPTNALSHMHVLALEDGGGGVTFGAGSNDGAVRSKVMSVGNSDDWTVVPR